MDTPGAVLRSFGWATATGWLVCEFAGWKATMNTSIMVGTGRFRVRQAVHRHFYSNQGKGIRRAAVRHGESRPIINCDGQPWNAGKRVALILRGVLLDQESLLVIDPSSLW